MSKNFYSKFHYADFIQDTELLSLKAVGAWTRILCRMWKQEKHTLEMSWPQFARLLRVEEKEAKKVYQELLKEKIFNTPKKQNVTACHALSHNFHSDVTIICRRLKREESIRENSKLRKQKERAK